MSNELYCFVTDNDGHWYMIPVNQIKEFEEWVEEMEKDYIEEEIGFYTPVSFDFSEYGCDSPIFYQFKKEALIRR